MTPPAGADPGGLASSGHSDRDPGLLVDPALALSSQNVQVGGASTRPTNATLRGNRTRAFPPLRATTGEDPGRMLYKTVAHASEVIALDVEDLDLEARVTTATRN